MTKVKTSNDKNEKQIPFGDDNQRGRAKASKDTRMKAAPEARSKTVVLRTMPT
jgi:hypothetical protein